MNARTIGRLRIFVAIAIGFILVGNVLDLIEQVIAWTIGILGFIIYGFASIQANKSIETNSAYYFWRFAPTVLLVLIPIFITWQSEDIFQYYFWIKLSTKLIAPVALLGYVYYRLDREIQRLHL